MDSKKILWIVSLLIIIAAAYIPSFHYGLIWDSRPMIMENQLLKNDFSLSAPFLSGYWASTSQKFAGYDYYRPIMVLSFMIEKQLWGLHPFTLRLVNFFLFLLSVLIFFFFMRNQLPKKSDPLLAIFLFAFFPLHLDNIIWVVGRCDLLMLLFGLVSLYFFDRFLENRSIPCAAFSLTAYLMALFSKEASLFLFPLLVLHGVLRRRKRAFPFHSAVLILTILYWCLKTSIIGRGGMPFTLFQSAGENIGTLLGVLGYYFRSLLFPFSYNMFLPADLVNTPWYWIWGCLFLAGLGWMLIKTWKEPAWRAASAWICVFLGAHLLMVFTPIYPYSISTRYLLIPALGWTWILALLAGRLPDRTKKLAAAGLIPLMAAAVFYNARKYQTEIKFWETAHHSAPKDSFFLSKYAEETGKNEDWIRSEKLLRLALKEKMKPATAASIAMQIAWIEFRKARYGESQVWLKRLNTLPSDPILDINRLDLKWRICIATGDRDTAEGLLAEFQSLSGRESWISRQIELFKAFADWDSALYFMESEEIPIPAGILKIKNEFPGWSKDQKIRYFIGQGNFRFAWEYTEEDSSERLDIELEKTALALKAGLEEEGKKLLDALAERGKNNHRILNSLGNFLLFRFSRVEEATAFYKRSLAIYPFQPALREQLLILAGPP